MVGFLSLCILIACKNGTIGPPWPDILGLAWRCCGSGVDRLWVVKAPPEPLKKISAFILP